MKANPSARTYAAIAFLAGQLALAACSQRQEAPRPAPSPSLPAERPPPPPSPAAPPPPGNQPRVNWRDAPITPGDWHWAMEGQLSVARFGGNILVLSCDRRAGMVTLMRPGAAQGQVPMSIITSNMTRSVSALAVATNPPMIAASFTARDALLDAMAFSRGRFAVETAGMQTLYVPSWTEVSRVIEDCR